MVKHVPDGQDFSFDRSFGFTGSAGPQRTVSGPGGPKPYAKGGAHKPTKAVVAVVTPQEPSKPAHDPQNAARAAALIGALVGAKAARSGQMAPPRFAEGGETGPAMDEDRAIPPSKLVPTPRPNPMRDPADSPNWEDETISRDGMTHNVQFLKGTSTWRERPTDEGTSKPPHKANGGEFIQAGIKHPGRIKAMAKREGISTAAAAEKASHSKDPSLRAAGNLGKRFISGDLSHHGKRKG